jgi:hypothetical protein
LDNVLLDDTFNVELADLNSGEREARQKINQ